MSTHSPASAAATLNDAPVASASTKTILFEGRQVRRSRYAFVVRGVRPVQVIGAQARIGSRYKRRVDVRWLRRKLRRGPVVRVKLINEPQAAHRRARAVLVLEVDVERPTTPGGLVATAGDRAVTLHWTASSDDVSVAGYRVSDGEALVVKLPRDARSYEATGLSNGRTYTFAVRAVDEARQRSRPALITATPAPPAPPAPRPTRPDTQPPTTPAQLRAQPGDRTAALTWSPSRDDVGVKAYRVLRGGKLIATTAATHFDDAGLTNGTSYRYTVRAADAAGNQSPAAASVSVIPHVTVGAALPARLPESTGATFYVSPLGSDDNEGSIDAPWRTIQKAADTLTAGQTALVRGGTYREDVLITRAGTATAPMTIKAFRGERPILAPGTENTDDIPMDVDNGSAYVRLQGLIFQRATGAGTTNIYVAGTAHDIEISDCVVRYSARQGFFSEPSTSRVQIIGCYFHDNGGTGPFHLDHHIYIQGSHPAVINNLLVRAPNGNGIQLYPESDHAIIASNTIDSVGADGILVGSDNLVTTSHAVVVNNVVTNARRAVNTYWSSTGIGIGVGEGNAVRDNLAYGTSEAAFQGNGLSDNVSYEDNTVTDPLYADAAKGNYRLQAASPALNRADPDFTSPFDRVHKVRPNGEGPDLGAYER